RELGLDLRLAAAEEDRAEPAVELGQVLVARRPAAVVKQVEVAVEAEERAEDRRIEELDDRVDLVDAVLDRRAGQDEGVGAREALDGLGGLALPVLDPLCLVEDDDVRSETPHDLLAVGQD